MPEVDAVDHRKLAAAAFNETWRFLEKGHREADEDHRMVHLAHVSRDHWGVVGQPVHWARGEWQLSRVYAAVGNGETALKHAKRCLEIGERNGLGDFDIAAAHEALVRAYMVGGDFAAAREEFAAAITVAGRVVEPEDRAVLLADLREHASALDIPWEEH